MAWLASHPNNISVGTACVHELSAWCGVRRGVPRGRHLFRRAFVRFRRVRPGVPRDPATACFGARVSCGRTCHNWIRGTDEFTTRTKKGSATTAPRRGEAGRCAMAKPATGRLADFKSRPVLITMIFSTAIARCPSADTSKPGDHFGNHGCFDCNDVDWCKDTFAEGPFVPSFACVGDPFCYRYPYFPGECRYISSISKSGPGIALFDPYKTCETNADCKVCVVRERDWRGIFHYHDTTTCDADAFPAQCVNISGSLLAQQQEAGITPAEALSGYRGKLEADKLEADKLRDRRDP